MLLNSSKKSTYLILLISVSVHFFGGILLACFLTIFLLVPSQVVKSLKIRYVLAV
jgi:hypothetical protein